ncbi:MAG: hypothetical protein R3E39_23560 [Anaerolineae bacterium]
MGTSTACWLIKNHVVKVTNIGKLTADDFRSVDKDILALMDETTGEQPVHVIVDCLQLDGLPGLSDLEGGRILKYLFDKRAGWTIVVDSRSNFLLNILSKVLTSVAHKQFTTTKTVDSALRTIATADSSVNLDEVEAQQVA